MVSKIFLFEILMNFRPSRRHDLGAPAIHALLGREESAVLKGLRTANPFERNYCRTEDNRFNRVSMDDSACQMQNFVKVLTLEDDIICQSSPPISVPEAAGISWSLYCNW